MCVKSCILKRHKAFFDNSWMNAFVQRELNGFQRVGCASGFCLGEQWRMLLALKAGKWKRACSEFAKLEISNSYEETLITFSHGDSSHLD